MSIHNQIYNLLYHWNERRTWKSKRKSPGSFQKSLALKKTIMSSNKDFWIISCLQALQYILYAPSRLKQSFSFSWWTVFIFKSSFQECITIIVLKIEHTRNQPPYCLLRLNEKMVFHLPRSGCLETPLTLPQSLYGQTDVRWRQNQNFSDQRVTKFAYPWCSESSAIKHSSLYNNKDNLG